MTVEQLGIIAGSAALVALLVLATLAAVKKIDARRKAAKAGQDARKLDAAIADPHTPFSNDYFGERYRDEQARLQAQREAEERAARIAAGEKVDALPAKKGA